MSLDDNVDISKQSPKELHQTQLSNDIDPQNKLKNFRKSNSNSTIPLHPWELLLLHKNPTNKYISSKIINKNQHDCFDDEWLYETGKFRILLKKRWKNDHNGIKCQKLCQNEEKCKFFVTDPKAMLCFLLSNRPYATFRHKRPKGTHVFGPKFCPGPKLSIPRQPNGD